MNQVNEDNRLYIRINSEDKKFLKEKAESYRLSLSEYLRRCGLSKNVPTPISQFDAQAYLVLGEIACQLESFIKKKKIPSDEIKSMTAKLRDLQRKAIGLDNGVTE